MTTDDTILNLAKKLHALAERGVGGEKETAAAMLTRLIKKHGLSIDDVTSDHRDMRRVYIPRGCKRLFVRQVIASVLGPVDTYRSPGEQCVVVETTVAEHLEIFEKVEHYWKLYRDEQKVFYDAFIQANKLYTKGSGKPKDAPDEPLTKEELAHPARMMQMMQHIRTDTPTKRLERPEKLTA